MSAIAGQIGYGKFLAPARLVLLCILVLACLGLVWSQSPALQNKTCDPNCGAFGLVQPDPLSAHGVTILRTGPVSAYAPAGIGRWDMAITQENIAITICKPGYTGIVRNGKGAEFGAITEGIKTKVYQMDGKTPDHLGPGKSHCCEVDHYYPLELGGANVIANLWAESWDHPYGARDKDKVETGLKRLVCAALNPLPLQQARDCLAADWVACGRQHKLL